MAWLNEIGLTHRIASALLRPIRLKRANMNEGGLLVVSVVMRDCILYRSNRLSGGAYVVAPRLTGAAITAGFCIHD